MNQYFNQVYNNMKQSGEHNYFTKGEPKTQMQLVFQNHFKTILDYYTQNKTNLIPFKVMEQGCGAGNLSLYFANNWSDVTCMDIEEEALRNTKENFQRCGLTAEFILQDASSSADVPPEGKYDLIYSVGLLEHLKLCNIDELISNNYNLLKPGGMIMHYVVPPKVSIQHKFNWINTLLSKFIKTPDKPDVTVPRYNYSAECYRYLSTMNGFDFVRVEWCMPIPLISPSMKFPFTKCPAIIERCVIMLQKLLIRCNGWICDEKDAQGFYLIAVK